MLNSMNMKLTISAAIIVVVAVTLVVTGLTKPETDDSHGMLIDFGYWDVTWKEMTFEDGMNGYDALDTVCGMLGYKVQYNSDGTVLAIDGKMALKDMPWSLYKLDDKNKWAVVEDPKEFEVSDENILCWARAGSAEDVVTPTDSTGHLYFGYASEGKSKRTGNLLKVVSLAPSITETICELGGLDNIAGTDVYSDYPKEIVERKQSGLIAETGGYMDPSYELIVKVNPDLVFLDGSVGQQVTIADKLRKSGISCCVLFDSVDINALYSNIWVTACALGWPDHATAEIQNEKRVIDDVAGIAGVTNMRTFITLSTDPSPWTAGNQTYINDIILTDGGVNVFDDFPSWFMVSKEQIYAKQPSVIIIMTAEKVTDEAGYQAMLDGMDSLWKQTPAFQDGNVYVFSGQADDVLSRPGPRLSEAAELIAKALNPTAFHDLDVSDVLPKFVHDDYRNYLKYQGDES
jgi:iron complex transport system substrate-binding protein